MKNGADNFTAERVAELRKNIDFSDILEIKDFSGGHLRNWKPATSQKNQEAVRQISNSFFRN